MRTPGEYKTVQARILEYAGAVGWIFVPCKEAVQRRGFDPETVPRDRAKGASLFFNDLLDAKVRKFNLHCAEGGHCFCDSRVTGPELIWNHL